MALAPRDRSRRLPRPASIALGAAGAAAIVALAPPVCPAHPGHLIDASSIHPTCKISLAKDRITLDYELSFGTIASLLQRQVMDRDGDGRLAREEQAAFARDTATAVGGRVALRLNGGPLPLTLSHERLAVIDARVVPVPMRLNLRLAAALPPLGAGTHDISLIDQNAWNNAAVAIAPILLKDPGVRLVRRSPAIAEADAPLPPPADAEAPVLLAIALDAGSQEQPPAAPEAAQPTETTAPDDKTDDLARLISREHLAPGVILAALIAAFLLGAGHALEPGHGKTMVAAYLIGSRGTIWHAITLGIIVTLTHTAGVFILGLVLLNAYAAFAPESVVFWTGLASGLLVMLVGAWMILREPFPKHAHHHHHGGNAHGHPHPHDAHDHHHHPAPTVTWTNLVSLGISGGLVPCPAALVVLLAALSLNRVALGLVLLLAFSAGLAAVLIIIGVLIVTAGRWLHRFDRLQGFARLLPRLSGIVILLLGAAIAAHALVAAGILSMQK